MERMTHKVGSGANARYWSPNRKDELVGRLAEYENTGLEPGQVHEMDVLYQELAHEVAGLREGTRWVPVAERLPGEDEIVLVQVSGKPAANVTLHDAMELAQHVPGEGWIISEWPEWEGAAPVAWMPLPGAFREKGEAR